MKYLVTVPALVLVLASSAHVDKAPDYARFLAQQSCNLMQEEGVDPALAARIAKRRALNSPHAHALKTAWEDGSYYMSVVEALIDDCPDYFHNFK